MMRHKKSITEYSRAVDIAVAAVLIPLTILGGAAIFDLRTPNDDLAFPAAVRIANAILATATGTLGISWIFGAFMSRKLIEKILGTEEQFGHTLKTTKFFVATLLLGTSFAGMVVCAFVMFSFGWSVFFLLYAVQSLSLQRAFSDEVAAVVMNRRANTQTIDNATQSDENQRMGRALEAFCNMSTLRRAQYTRHLALTLIACTLLVWAAGGLEYAWINFALTGAYITSLIYEIIQQYHILISRE